jgi:hypothetical protein
MLLMNQKNSRRNMACRHLRTMMDKVTATSVGLHQACCTFTAQIRSGVQR